MRRLSTLHSLPNLTGSSGYKSVLHSTKRHGFHNPHTQEVFPDWLAPFHRMAGVLIICETIIPSKKRKSTSFKRHRRQKKKKYKHKTYNKIFFSKNLYRQFICKFSYSIRVWRWGKCGKIPILIPDKGSYDYSDVVSISLLISEL